MTLEHALGELSQLEGMIRFLELALTPFVILAYFIILVLSKPLGKKAAFVLLALAALAPWYPTFFLHYLCSLAKVEAGVQRAAEYQRRAVQTWTHTLWIPLSVTSLAFCFLPLISKRTQKEPKSVDDASGQS